MRPAHLIPVIVLIFALMGTPAMAVEEPPYTLVTRDGAFEVRDYPALVVAEVTVTGDQTQAASAGFRLLAGYIFGANRRRQSIAMTVPVAQSRVGEKIAMTAPVAQTRTGDHWVVRFTMPRAYTLQTLPEPDDARVHLRATSPERVGVVRFSGLARPDAVVTQTLQLEAWLERHGRRPAGPASLAQYDPPWTLWFMRRNEVMIPIAQ
jgi:hypothetical protein